MANQIKGRIFRRMPVESREYQGKTFESQKVYINATTFDPETGEERPNFLLIEFGGRMIPEIANCADGDRVEISITNKGRFYTKDGEEKHFQQIIGWKIERLEARNIPATSVNAPTNTPPMPANDIPMPDIADDLFADDDPFGA